MRNLLYIFADFGHKVIDLYDDLGPFALACCLLEAGIITAAVMVLAACVAAL